MTILPVQWIMNSTNIVDKYSIVFTEHLTVKLMHWYKQIIYFISPGMALRLGHELQNIKLYLENHYRYKHYSLESIL